MGFNRKKDVAEKYMELNASMQGKLVFSEPVNLRINGRFEGDLDSRGNLVIDKDAVVMAGLSGDSITISGKVQGRITASKRLTFTSTAEVTGDVETPFLVVESGARFNGLCKTTDHKMTVEELADFLSIEENKIVQWAETGQIPVEKRGNEFLFDHKQVEAWLSRPA